MPDRVELPSMCPVGEIVSFKKNATRVCKIHICFEYSMYINCTVQYIYTIIVHIIALRDMYG